MLFCKNVFILAYTKPYKTVRFPHATPYTLSYSGCAQPSVQKRFFCSIFLLKTKQSKPMSIVQTTFYDNSKKYKFCNISYLSGQEKFPTLCEKNSVNTRLFQQRKIQHQRTWSKPCSAWRKTLDPFYKRKAAQHPDGRLKSLKKTKHKETIKAFEEN